MAAIGVREANRRNAIRRMQNRMKLVASRSFTTEEMVRNAALVVWTRGQMNGLRAVIKRLGMV